jgi:hypothetical protein
VSPRHPPPLIALVAALQITACADLGVNDERQTTLWNTDMQPEPAFAGLSGQAAAVSQISGTDATILLQGAQPTTEFAWGLRLGTCASPGQQIGPDNDYPEMVADDQGGATADAALGPMLRLDESYHIEARMPDSEGRTRVACGDLAGEAP